MKDFLSILIEDFEVNRYFNQRLFLFVLRGNTLSSNKMMVLLFKILNVLVLEFIFNCDIPRGVYIGRRIRIPHPYNIIIKKKCRIMNGITIFHGVTIGSNEKYDNETIIEDNVYIGCNALLIGINAVGENSKIGAGSIILKDIEKNKTIVGVYK